VRRAALRAGPGVNVRDGLFAAGDFFRREFLIERRAPALNRPPDRRIRRAMNLRT